MSKIPSVPRFLPDPLPLVAMLMPILLSVGGCQSPSQTPSQGQKVENPELVLAELTFVDPPAAADSLAAEWATGIDLWLSWLQPQADGHSLMASQLLDNSWSEPEEVTRGTEFFANWADRPGLVVTSTGLTAHWLEKLGDHTYAYGAQLAHRPHNSDSGWRSLGLLHDDDSATEHGFVSYLPMADGSVRAFWLDGREMANGGDMELRTTWLESSVGNDTMADNTMAGDTAVPTVTEGTSDGPVIAPSQRLDSRVCECCDTDAALTSEGPVVAYRDRDDQEIRDIAVVRLGLSGWSSPALVHADGWQIQGCPVNGPALAAEGRRVALAWFTAAQDPRVLVAFSQDAGATFSAPIQVSHDPALGRLDLVMNDQGDAMVSWMALAGDQAEIRLRRITPEGAEAKIWRLASTAAGRSSGVPRMVRQGSRLYFVWLEGGPTADPRLRVGFLPLGASNL